MSECGRCGHAGRNHTYGGNCQVWGCPCAGYKFTDHPYEERRIPSDRFENPAITELRKFLSAICLELKARLEGDKR